MLALPTKIPFRRSIGAMKSIPFPRLLSFFSLLVLLVLAADTFLFPSNHIREVYDRGYTIDMRGSAFRSVPRSFESDYILATSGDKLHIPYNLRNGYSLEENDTFYIDRSLLLHQPIDLEYPVSSGHGFALLPMGLLNSGWYGPLAALFILFSAVAQFLPFISPDRRETFAYISLVTAVFVAINYFWH
jgi:hypothetical protein